MSTFCTAQRSRGRNAGTLHPCDLFIEPGSPMPAAAQTARVGRRPHTL